MIIIPVQNMGFVIYTVFFVVAMGLVYLYWHVMYYVSKEDVKLSANNYDIFVGKVPTDPNADLQRGRLVITNDRILLYQRNAHRKKDGPAKITWSIDRASVTAVDFGKVVGARYGFTLYLNGEDSVSFTASVKKKKSELCKALGFNYSPNQEK